MRSFMYNRYSSNVLIGDRAKGVGEMKVFVARQPIFDRKGQSVAYELLYRNGNSSNSFPDIDGDEATADVIINSFINIGLEELAQGKRCFINFTESLLKMNLPSYFNPGSIVVEILEDVPITEELIEICAELKKLGYTIALDDFNLQQNYFLLPKLLKYIDIIKVDFLQTQVQKRKQIMNRYKQYGVSFLAEKVETQEEYQLALRDGYDYYQGYFFSKPVVLSSYDIPVYIHGYLQILHELSKTEPDIDKISEQIEQDLSLSYKLLKLMNSPAFRPKNKIKSIKQAIVLLGLNEIKKWIYILSIKNLNFKNDPIQEEVIRLSLMRAKLCERLSIKIGRTEPSLYMLTGMFSLVDALLHRNLDDVLNELPLSDEIREALSGVENDIRKVLKWAIEIEKSNWHTQDLPLSPEEIQECYMEAILWSNHLLNGEEIAQTS